jgi:acetyl-CoA synthetase
MLTPDDIVYRAESADVKAIIATDEEDVCNHILEAKKRLSSVKYYYCVSERENFIYLKNEIDKGKDVLNVADKPVLSDTMLIYFTSGSEGHPKMVTHDFKYPLGHIMTAYYWQCVVDDGLHLTLAETGWAKFSWGQIYGQWISGTAVFCYDYHNRFSPADILPLISKYKITTFCAPSTALTFLAGIDWDAYDLSSIVHATTAGAPLPAEIFTRFLKKTGIEIKEGFGQTESAVITAAFKYIKARPGSIGYPAPIYDLQLLTENGDEITEPDKFGEICIKLKKDQYGLLTGYYKDAERTEKCFAGGYYHTGDVASFDADGYLWFAGRLDNMIKSNGYRISPAEVEGVLYAHPAVYECAVSGPKDPVRGQVVKATIVLNKEYLDKANLTLIKEIQQFVKEKTAPYKYPRIVEFVESLPKTSNGVKIKYGELRK